jgi:endonuclease/exonuclease/phosphatase family metal-dependent hydrolase
MKNAELSETEFVARRLKFPLCARGWWLLMIAIFVVSFNLRAGQPPFSTKRSFGTMTVNLYIGAGVERIFALDPLDSNYPTNLVITTTGVFYEILASQPPVRIAGVADAIAARMPDLVAVQEATLIRQQSPGDFASSGTTSTTIDYVQILLDSLAARGAHYAVVSSSEELDIQLPVFNIFTRQLDDIHQTDREVILARTDLPSGQFRVSRPRQGTFSNLLVVPSADLAIKRGWCSVDVFARGRVFRYICTHLEQETFPLLQAAQALELLNGPAKVNMPVMICGDFNADPLHRDGSFAYDIFPRFGCHDAWAETRPGNRSGNLTWGHDEFLANPSKLFDRRIDLIFYKGGVFNPIQADVLDLQLDRFIFPLWASDHAAVTADFILR